MTDRPGRALGIDLGTKRIGVALSDPTRTIASPLTMVERSGDRRVDHRALRDLAVENEVKLVVVGVPLSLSGAVGPAARAARTEIDELRAALGERCPVVEHDERLTTVTADRALRAGSVRGRDRRTKIDKVAASVMLQHYLDGSGR